jgi:hypothetical protein
MPLDQNSIAATNLDEPIYGAEEIGRVVKMTERQAFHALESGYLPATKVGRKWASTPRRLLAHFSGSKPAA